MDLPSKSIFVCFYEASMGWDHRFFPWHQATSFTEVQPKNKTSKGLVEAGIDCPSLGFTICPDPV